MTVPPKIVDIVPQQWASIIEAFEKLVPEDSYLHWDDIRKQPQPTGIGYEAWWAALKLGRSARRRFICFGEQGEAPFGFNLTDGLVEILHELDHGEGNEAVSSQDLRRVIASALFEEAIASSRLAGAATDYAVAKELLRSGRPPQERGEQMIVNQQRALERVGVLRDRELCPEFVLELHRCITEGTLDEPGAAGRIRGKNETAPLVEPMAAGQCNPPPADELPQRLERMCAFANGRAPEFFIHPVIRGIILHFWLAHDRPFLDGNGRTARTLFRWVMLHQAYPLFELLALSPGLLQAPAGYARAFLQTESDDNDLTYFILHQATAIRTAARALHDRAVRKIDEMRGAKEKFRGLADLNLRQQALIAHALRKPDTQYVVAGHQRSHGVTHQTARDDLFDLIRRELLVVGKEGRRYVFQAPTDLARRLQFAAGRRRIKPIAQGDELPTALL